MQAKFYGLTILNKVAQKVFYCGRIDFMCGRVLGPDRTVKLQPAAPFKRLIYGGQ